MAKQLHVSLTMDADTKQAKAKIAELQSQLQSIKTAPTKLFDDVSLQKASKAAAELQNHLRAATDVDTGKLNLTKFATSLEKSGKTLEHYKTNLELIGPAGQQAFLSVARGIVSAEAPAVRLNRQMTEFLTTLKNTARWQISSSILHGFMGSISSAYGYAQKLDKSLNNIRIVTGKSTSEMAQFAEQANKAARNLSATTTAYTDAALIFYQQGLEGKAVTERTDAVIKMTNVTGESAEEVSSYMTAIWNNFANGSKELEYYADVITALGAATASSTDEIAAGLEKFAAISETVGLSYEYATTALATVTAETRQSADVVGTAFKTIFSRIQGLSLGETLEDGTDLNKYSSALLAVGINIKDANGELKDMDDILDELGAKWETLHRDEQLALAQTVAGVRQYNQLISLMDNWDIFNQNLNTAQNSSGELDKQAEIYAESWEGARDRVRAAAENIYNSLIDENFFIDVANITEKLLGMLDGLIDGFGGVKGILGIIGSLITQHLAKEAPAALSRIKENLMVITGQGDKLAQKTLGEVGTILQNTPRSETDSAYNVQITGLNKISEMKSQLISKQHTLSEAERQTAEAMILEAEQSYKILENLGYQVNKAREKVEIEKNAIASQATQSESNRVQSETGQGFDAQFFAEQKKLIKSTLDELQAYYKALGQIKATSKSMSQQVAVWKKNNIEVGKLREKIQAYLKHLNDVKKIKLSSQPFEKINKMLENNCDNAEELYEELLKISQLNGDQGNSSAFFAVDDMEGTVSTIEQLGDGLSDCQVRLQNMGVSSEQLSNLEDSMSELGTETATLEEGLDGVENSLGGLPEHAVTATEAIMSVGSSLMSLSATINSVKSVSELFSKEDATAIDYITGFIGLLTTGLMTYSAVQKTVDTLHKKSIATKMAEAAATGVQTAADAAHTAGLWAQLLALMANPYFTGACLASLAIATVAIGAMTAKTKAHTQELKDNTEAAKEQLNTTKENIEAHKELLETFDTAYEKYQETGIITQDLRQATDDLTNAYELQGGRIALLTGNYDEYIEKLKEARAEELKFGKQDAYDVMSSSADEMAYAFQDYADSQGLNMDGSIAFSAGSSTSDEDAFNRVLEQQYSQGNLSSDWGYYSNGFGVERWVGMDMPETSAEIVAAYEDMKTLMLAAQESMTIEERNESEYYQKIKQMVQDLEAVYTEYDNARQLFEEYSFEQYTINNSDSINNVSSVSEYLALREDMLQSLAEENDMLDENGNILESREKDYEELEGAIDTYLRTSNDNLANLQDLNETFQENAYLHDGDASWFENIYNGLTDEQKAVFLHVDFEKYRTEEAILRQVEYLQGLADQEQINFRTNLLDTASGELNKDGTLSEDTRTELANNYDINWQEFDGQSTIDQLRTINELAREEISLRQEAFDAEAEWIGQEILSQEDLEQARLDANQAWEDAQAALDSWWESHPDIQDEIDLEASGQANIDEVNALSEAVLNARAEIERLNSIEIVPSINETILANLTDLTNRLVSLSDGLKTASSLIEADYIVEADNIEKLATMYPELLRNAKVYEDGRVQLDQAAVQQILGNEVDILNADKDTVRSQLQNQITLLDVQIRFYETKKELLSKALNNEIEYEEAMAGISEAEAQYEVDMNDWATQHGMDNSKISTTLALENLQTIDEKIAEISEHYSRMLSGEVVVAGELLTGSSGSTASQGDKPTGIDNSDYFAELQAELDSTNEQLETLYDTRADLVVLESKLGESVVGAVESMTGALEGTGGNIDDKDSGKEKEKEIKKLDDEIDRYHEIKELLEDIGVELNRIQKKKDRAWGGGKLAAINEETAALKQQLSALKQYQSQIESNLSKDKGALGQYGWSLDGNGNVSNYESNMARLVNQWNNSAQEDADKEYFENAKKALQQYEESKDLYDDVIDQITDATYALADAELEAIEYSVEIHLELDDNKLKLLEDIMETIGDSAARAVDNIEMIEKSIDTVLHQMETSKDGMKSIFDYIGLSGDVANRIMNGTASEGDQKSLAEILNSYGGAIDMDRVVQDLQQYQDNLLSYNEALRNYRDQVFETVNNAFTEHLEDFDRANDKIAHCVSLVSGYKDLIEAIGRKNIDVHGELTQKLNQALEAQAEDAHRAALAKEKYAQSAYQEALEGYQTAIETGDEYAINKWTEILETAQDELQAAKEDSQAALTEWANAIAESFSSAIQQVIDDLDTALGGLKLLREDFDMAQEIDAQYLDDYEKIYQLSKLTREVQASMDETDNVAAKKALMEYQSKINAYQQQGVQMSQYELDYLRAQYELELARIALEESQNAKSQVSMVKDAEGNYSYVYTADDEAVAEAEQTYEDRLYEMQRLNGDYINELQSNIITMQEEMSAKLEEIANNDLLSYEDKMLRMDEVRSYYLERIHFYDSQLGISIENNKELYDNEWTEYSAKTGYKISANEDYVDSWEETTLAILTNVETQEDYLDQLEQAINHATEEAENCCERAQDALNEAGMTTEELGQTISQTTDELIRDADDAANSAEQMSDEYQRAMQEIMNAATSFTSAYASMISSTIAQNQSLIASMQSVIQMALQMKAALAGASSSGGIGGGSGGGSGGSGGGGNSGQASSLAQSALTLLNEVHHGKYGTNGWIPGAKSAGYDQRVISLVLQALNDSKAGGGYDYFYDKAKQLLGFNTGGYTGNWGTSQGRLALLHQKELVLNAQDTPNILDAVGIVRDIAKAIDINALSAMVNGGLTAATFSNGKEEVLEQNVHITAEFPNATDKHEILEAFDNVINLAAQYANRKN